MYQVPQPEELAPAIHPRIMANRNLDHSKSRQFEFFGHFNADDTTSGLEGNGIEDVTAEKPKIAIDVANRQAEHPSHRAPVCGADPDAIPGVGAFDFVTVDKINVGREFGQEIVHFAHVVLAIAIRIEDEIFLDVCETGNQCRSVAEISFVMNHSQVG